MHTVNCHLYNRYGRNKHSFTSLPGSPIQWLVDHSSSFPSTAYCGRPFPYTKHPPSSCAQSSLTVWPHELQPTRLLCPWDDPGKNTGVGCHFLLQGIFLTQGSNLVSLMAPALAGGFFTTESPGTLNVKVWNAHKNSTQAKPFCLYTKPCTWHGQSTRCDLKSFQGHLCLCDLNPRLKPNSISRQLRLLKWLLCIKLQSHELWRIPIDLSPKCPQVLTTRQGWKKPCISWTL